MIKDWKGVKSLTDDQLSCTHAVPGRHLFREDPECPVFLNYRCIRCGASVGRIIAHVVRKNIPDLRKPLADVVRTESNGEGGVIVVLRAKHLRAARRIMQWFRTSTDKGT